MSPSASLVSRCLFSVLCFVFALASFAVAKDARQFIGHYQISNVTQEGTLVHLTMRLEIFNYSGQDIRQGAVALYTSDLRAQPLGGFSSLKLLLNRRSADITHDFTVPVKEYQRWTTAGVRPALFFLFKDASGKTLKRSVTASRSILPSSTAR